jgi:DNA-binding winged helix-turn-helix (wHTH) protein/TolB-like protein
MRFGEFSVDLSAGELHRNGTKVRLQELPFRVLAELASRPGEVVTRDELRARLWDASTFVDAEAGLNTAVAKLREALGDSAETPRFIETLPKRGYRFIARVQGPELVQSPGVVPSPEVVRRPKNLLAIVFVALALVVGVSTVVAVVMMARAQAAKTTIAVVLFHNETGDPGFDRLAQQLTDATVVALAANPQYAIIGNAPILRTPRIFEDVKKIGDELHADYVLIAQLQNPADGLTLRVHFISTSDQKHLWAKGIAGSPTELEQRVVQTVREGVAVSLHK